jgi:hypothetical protein
MDTKPTHEQAKLQLELYDLRREARMRQARDWYFKNYFADSFEESMRLAAPGTDAGASVMMVISYWEQACSMLNYGLLHEDLFFENNGEFFGVWERIKPSIAQFREKFAYKQYMGQMEKAAQRFESWMESRSPGHIAGMREWMKQMRTQVQKVA